MNDERRKLLTKYLGECWHEWEMYYSEEDKCAGYRCKNPQCPLHNILLTTPGIKDVKHLRTFTTWNDLGALKERMDELGEWEDFYEYTWDVWHSVKYSPADWHDYFDWLLNPVRFCEAVAEWLESKEGRK
jgi:hypothetical protein